MFKDKYGQLIFNENDLVDLYLTDTEFSTKREILVENHILFDDSLDLKTPTKGWGMFKTI